MKGWFPLTSYASGNVTLKEYLGWESNPRWDAKEKEKPKQGKKEEPIERVEGIKRKDIKYGRKMGVLPLWQVVDENGSVLGSLSLQSGGKARLILGAKKLSCKLQGVQHKRK